MNRRADNGVLLLVEDNPRDAELALRALRKSHPADKLVWAKDGAEAMEFIFGPGGGGGSEVPRRPKVVLLDLKMPKVDGLDLLRRIKSDPRTRTIPVVVLTSSLEDQDLWRSYELGVNSYVVKPVDFKKFSEAVTRLGNYWSLLNHSPVHPPSGHDASPTP